MIQALHAQYPNITQLIPVQYKTNGYRRRAMASIGCSVPTSGGNSGLPGTPGAAPAGFATPSTCSTTGGVTSQAARAVVLTTWEWGQDDNDPTQDGNSVTYQQLNPGAPNSPLSVSVTGHAITVSLATDATGALSSTTDQVDRRDQRRIRPPRRSSGPTRYRGNAKRRPRSRSRRPRRAPERLPLGAAGGDASVDPGYRVPRMQYQQYILRICKVCDGSKTGFFVYAQEHAREWVGPLVALETANRLLKNYGTDPRRRAFVDNLDIFIDPSVNPDGGNYSMLQGGGSGQRGTMTELLRPAQRGRRGRRRRVDVVRPGLARELGRRRQPRLLRRLVVRRLRGRVVELHERHYAGPASSTSRRTRTRSWLAVARTRTSGSR